MDLAANDFLSFTGFFKATPAEEAGQRVLYLEAANETRDYQNEVVLAKALAESSEYYLRYGNIDVDHVTQIGAKQGIPNYLGFEIGRPVDVRVDGPAVFVKALLYAGDNPAADMANQVWGSMQLRPPARWYPSVGGAIQDRVPVIDHATGDRHSVVRKVRWTNIGLSKTPVNPAVPVASTVPLGTLAKSWGVAGLDLSKTLTAGYGTDSATLTGGAAVRKQSLDGTIQSYWDFRDRLAGDIRRKRVEANSAAMQAHGVSAFGLSESESADWTERFLNDLQAGLSKRKSHA